MPAFGVQVLQGWRVTGSGIEGLGFLGLGYGLR